MHYPCEWTDQPYRQFWGTFLMEHRKNLIDRCIKPNFGSASRRWQILEDYRKWVKVDATKIPCISCSICLSYFTCFDVITALLEHGYQRYYGRKKPTNAEVENLIWTGLPQNPQNGDLLQIDRWLLNLASIEAAVNIHDWRHRESCFKNY